MSSSEDHVEHHGVKGMKWGVRRKSLSIQRNASKQRKLAKQTDKINKRRDELELEQYKLSGAKRREVRSEKKLLRNARNETKRSTIDYINSGEKAALDALNTIANQRIEQRSSKVSIDGKATALGVLAVAGVLGVGELTRNQD